MRVQGVHGLSRWMAMNDKLHLALLLELAEMLKLQYISRSMYGRCILMLCPGWIAAYSHVAPEELIHQLMADVLSRVEALV